MYLVDIFQMKLGEDFAIKILNNIVLLVKIKFAISGTFTQDRTHVS